MNPAPSADIESEVDHLLERTILDIGIPPCPDILARFMAEMNKDEPDYNRLASLIGADVSVSAGLIKTANSPFFGLRQKVRSGVEALAMLGMKTTSHTVAGIILRNSFPNIPNLERFWDASARVARVSAWLAQHLDIRGLRTDDAYTFGLFRDCGIPVLLGRFKNYEAVLEMAEREIERSFVAVEEDGIPVNHASVGGILAQSWYLPKEICLAICNHHDVTALGSTNSQLPLPSKRLIAIAQLAEHLVQHQLGVSFTQEWAKLGAACLQLLNLGEEQLPALYTEAESIVIGEE